MSWFTMSPRSPKAAIGSPREQERMASIIAGTRTGTWEWDIESGEIKVNEQWLAIIGMSNEDMPDLTADTWLSLSTQKTDPS